MIYAAQEGRDPRDGDLEAALDEMLSDAEALTRTLLGGEGAAFGSPGAGYGLDDDGHDPGDGDEGDDEGAATWRMRFDG